MSVTPIKQAGLLTIQQFQRAVTASETKLAEVDSRPSHTARRLATDLIKFNLFSPTIIKTAKELVKSVSGLATTVFKVARNPRAALTAVRMFRGDYSAFEEYFIKNIPIKKPEYKGFREGLYLIPFEQFDPNSNQCFKQGDSSLGMELKQYDGSSMIVEHNGKKGELYVITDKNSDRYGILRELFGVSGPLGAGDHKEHERAKALINYKKYFSTSAIKEGREGIANTIYQNAIHIEKLLKSGNEFDLKKEWRSSVSDTLFKCMIGDISEEDKNSIIEYIDKGFKYLIRVKALSPIKGGLTVFSRKNQEGEEALKELDRIGLKMLIKRLKTLQEKTEPEDLFDEFALAAVKLVNDGSHTPEEAAFEVSKIFFEMIGAGFFTRLESRSNFDHLALTDPDFRQGLEQALDNFNSKDLNGIIREALANENLLKPFQAAACAALAYQPTVLFVSRNFRIVLRDPEQKEEITELKDYELKQLIQKYKLEHPLLAIGQNKEVIYPLGGYCREGLRRGEFLRNNRLNSNEVFNPEKLKEITDIGSWQFGMGTRGCLGGRLAVETLTWDALCMAYLLKNFPGMKISGETKINFNIFLGKEFNVINK